MEQSKQSEKTGKRNIFNNLELSITDFYTNVTNILYIQRLVLFDSLRNFLPLRLEILLYGNPNLSDAENKIIFESVYIFIKNSNRFD